jgi:glutathione S-transferase
VFEELLCDGPWFAGARFSIDDAAYAPVFRYFDVFDRFVDHDIFSGKPKVAAWRAALRMRPSVQGAVSPNYGELLAQFVASKISHLAAAAGGVINHGGADPWTSGLAAACRWLG